MFGKLVALYSRVNPRRVPEESLGLRLSVLAAILTAEITILGMGYYGTFDLIAVPVLTAAGFALSYRRRRLRNLGLKFLLSMLVIAATAFFLRDLMSSMYDTRLPLIKLLLWLQVLHSFDVPACRDLKFSLASGLTLIAAGAVLSTGMAYAAGLVLFSAAASVALVCSHISEKKEGVETSLPAGPRLVIAYSFAVWLFCVTLAIPLLMIIPQGTQARLHSLPLSDLRQILGDFSSDVENPFYESEGNPFDLPPRYDTGSYFGFNNYMDLRSRGNPSDEIVMKVRTDDYAFYRGIVFDIYNGKGWEMSPADTTEIVGTSPPIELNLTDFPYPRTKTSIQSFYIEADLPNIIFASWKPVSLFFPADRIKVDQFGSLRSPYQLTGDTVYSVISEQPAYSGDLLGHFPRTNDRQAPAVYTSLPSSPEMDEIERMARQIVQPHTSRYDQVLAIERYLKKNYAYDLDIAPQQKESDSVSYFLFEEKAGYCEHFASAMAVMARSVGIPARVVTGYTGGNFNPFTGLWEIRQSDAHAWVEIHFGAAGWVPFDPTPGFDMPSPGANEEGPWAGGRLLSYMGGLLERGPLGPVLHGAAGLAAEAMNILRAVPITLFTATGLCAALFLVALRKAAGPFVRKRRRRRQLLAGLHPDYLREPVLRVYYDLTDRLGSLGLVRRPQETLGQFSERVSRYLSAREFEMLSLMVEEQRYGAAENSRSRRKKARALADRVLGRIRERSEKSAAGPTSPA